MSDHLSESTWGLMRAVAPEPNPVQREMEARAEENDFPIIGPEAGGVLRLFARAVGASQVFEFGSGFGYSASWFLGGMDGGRIVLTEEDTEELDGAREYLDRLGYADRAVFEAGDAMETIERHDGPFDVVLIDHRKQDYLDALESVRGKLASPSVVIADNIASGPYSADDILALVEGELVPDPEEPSGGIAAYLGHVVDDPALDTSFLPVGNGLAVSCFDG